MSEEVMNDGRTRCGWVPLNDPLYVEYHDDEWGTPVHEDRLLFEFLVLEGAQAGLSWRTILGRRKNYRRVFDDFDATKISEYGDEKISELLEDPGIIRNRLKIRSVVLNARAYLKVRDEFGSFDSYLWRFVGGSPLDYRREKPGDIPANDVISDRLSRDLKKRGFRFVGSTICYAFMQAVGMVNDHTLDCFRHDEILEMK